MKKYLFVALASLFAFASCSKESNKTPEVNDKVVNLTFTSKRPQLKSESKTAWNGETIVWSEGDKIRVGYTLNGEWMGKSEAGEAKFYASDEVTFGSTASIGTFNVPINENSFDDPTVSGTYVFYGIYPSAASVNGASVSDPTNSSLILPSTQTPTSSSFDASGDLMIGKTAGMILSGLPTNAIEISWSRLVAHADLTFKNFAFNGVESIKTITLTSNTEAKIAGKFSVDVTTGNVTTSSSSTNTIVINGKNLSVNGSNVEAWCCLLPATLTSLDIVVQTDKATYSKSFTNISKTFLKNARNILAINMSQATRVELSSSNFAKYTGTLVEGDYIIYYNGYAMKSEVTTTQNKRLLYEEVTPEDDIISTTDNTIIWHIAPSGDYWTIYNADKDKFAAGTAKNEANLLADGTDDRCLWSVSGTETYEFVNKARAASSSNPGNKYLRNNGTNGFASYSESTGGALTLYKRQAPDTRIDPTLSYAISSVSVAWNDKEDFEAPTLQNPYSVTVSYSSSNKNVATVNDATGEITFVGNGNTTITASFIGNTTYKPCSTSYIISVTGAPEPGTEDNPYKVSAAIEVAEALGKNEKTTQEVYISGIVSQIVSYSSSYKSITYYISDNGTTTNQLQVYGGLNLIGVDFTGITDLAVGDVVVVKGYLYNFNGNTPEVYQNSHITSITKVTRYSITLGSVNNGTISASGSEAAEGATVMLNATPATGYALTSWNVINNTTSETVPVNNDSFTMPASDVTVSATFEVSSTASVTFDFSSISETVTGGWNGNHTVSPITITATNANTNKAGQVRFQNGGTVTFTGATITRIEIINSGAYPGNFSANVGDYTLSGNNGIWTGSATEVVLTNNGNGTRTTSIVVTYK